MKELAEQCGCGLGQVCAVLERPRSWFYYRRRVTKGRALRRPELAGLVRQIVHGRPATYGYRRVHAMLWEQGIWCDPKTVWAVLRRHHWLSTARGKPQWRGRRHKGRVAVLEPNRRWASDFTWLQAWNGEKGRLAVIIDCADRMILAWRFQPRLTTEQICEMVREAIFRRFGEDRRQAQGIELLTDNGPEFKTVFRRFVQSAGLVPCTTPCRSPESNGVVEAFFGTLKRDYVRQSGLETRAAIEHQLPGWIADYNEVGPHSALGMRSPARFYQDWKAKNALNAVQN